ncbi:MAG: hypothetical protein IIA87_00410 [Nanoarchaeota archaeon]|nr:hypothetical protein [Nanoarchaeota archaeon]
MIQIYGIIGLLLIIFSEVNFFLKIQPFEKFYFPIIWLGYILFIDSLAYKIKGKSLIKNNLPMLIGMFIISAPFWKIFEYVNLRVNNWHYIGTEFFGPYGDLFAFISFATVIPAFFVTLKLFNINFKKATPKDKITKNTFLIFIILGTLMFILPLIWPKYFFPLIWIFMFFILDPINYANKQPSIIYMLKTRQKSIIYLIISSLTLGFLWEFWNFWASVKWIYTIPFINFLHIFEMPLFGYLGYIPFGFGIFSFYFFVEYLFKKKTNYK